jgi:hypothetical protein
MAPSHGYRQPSVSDSVWSSPGANGILSICVVMIYLLADLLLAIIYLLVGGVLPIPSLLFVACTIGHVPSGMVHRACTVGDSIWSSRTAAAYWRPRASGIRATAWSKSVSCGSYSCHRTPSQNAVPVATHVYRFQL